MTLPGNKIFPRLQQLKMVPKQWYAYHL